MNTSKKFKDSVVELMVRRYKNGESMSEIAGRLDCSPQTVGNYLKRAKVKIRAPHATRKAMKGKNVSRTSNGSSAGFSNGGGGAGLVGGASPSHSPNYLSTEGTPLATATVGEIMEMKQPRKRRPFGVDSTGLVECKTFFGRTLRQMRIERGFTQTKLGKRCGCSAGHIGSLERGIYPPPTTFVLVLANAFNCDASKFYEKAADIPDGLIDFSPAVRVPVTAIGEAAEDRMPEIDRVIAEVRQESRGKSVALAGLKGLAERLSTVALRVEFELKDETLASELRQAARDAYHLAQNLEG